MKFIVLLLFSALFLNSFSQNKMSGNSSLALQENSGLLIENNGLLQALVLVNDKANDSIFRVNGIIVNGRFNKVWSVDFPIHKIAFLQSLECVEYIELATRANAARYKNDTERQFTSVDKVQNGLQNSLPLNYSGKGVIVGIVDVGFQGNNPTFFNSTGSKTRISRWWMQSNKAGTPPVGFSYGTELKDSSSIINANDNDGFHGTHVAGIAGGSGYSTPGLQYRGMAPESELVFVSIKYANDTLGGSALGDYIVANPSILDAYNYIFEYARSVGKPAVINLSWGMHTGPHDGTSLFDKATEGLVGKGQILVGANGNEGDNPMHWNHVFNSDTAGTLVIENNRQNIKKESVYADFWGGAFTDFSMKIQIIDTSKNLITETPFVRTDSENVNVFNLNADSSQFKIIMVCSRAHNINNKPNITLMAEQPNPKKYLIVARITAVNSEVHGWNSGSVRDWTSGSFRKKVGNVDFSNEFITGNTDNTNGENGGTSKAVISVGAMAARSAYRNFYGKLMNDSGYVLPGYITKFSSKGPTIDGRIKPDISAPGFDVPSSVNNKQMEGWMLDRTILKTVFRNDTNYWTTLNGTSMASPHVCGIVALILQANPDLNNEDVKKILQQTATVNTATGAVPNNQYGYGIVNAYEAVKLAIKYAEVNRLDKVGDVSVYPNPASTALNIDMNNPVKDLSCKILSADGKVVKAGVHPLIRSNGFILDISELMSGLYLLEIANGGQLYQFKFLKN